MGSRIRVNLIPVVPSHQGKIEFGGPCGDRTHDLRIKWQCAKKIDIDLPNSDTYYGAMKITSIETYPVGAGWKNWLFVRVMTDQDGLYGVSEATLNGFIKTTEAAIHELSHLVIGRDPHDVNAISRTVIETVQDAGHIHRLAMSAVEVACWDILGKSLGVPIYQLLGGKQHDEIRAYASILFGADGNETAEIGRRWVEAGYTAVKFGWEPMGTSEAVDIDLAHGAREGLGDDAALLIDAGCVWDARTALRRAEAFAEFDVEWLEEPLHQADVDGYAWLRDRSSVPIAAGEGECGRESFRPLIDRHALDVYQVDLSRNGFTDAAYVRDRVEEIGARLCNHCYTSPTTVAASAHWLSTCRDAFLIEDCVEDEPLRNELTLERVQAVDGMISVPDGPGLGVTLNEDFVQSHMVSESQ